MSDDMPQKITTHATRAFRDTADKDYITARMCLKNRLPQQFLWSTQQAFEKYLKAILLYNRIPNTKPSHDLMYLYTKVQGIDGLDFSIPEVSENFIFHINNQEPNRYFDKPYFLTIDADELLDQTVWSIRRFCYQMKPYVSKRTTTLEDEKEKALALKPRETQIKNGFLEKVLENRQDPRRKYLTWHNQYYGQSHLKTDFAGFQFGNPGYFTDQPKGADDLALFEQLNKLIFFPKDLRDHMQEKTQSQ
ncbi:MAG: HEPN domain-containing protein [Coriobacteriia bacterium]|nr:HEPN domain-containing protein [Coriobacteriia bacterium]